MIWFNGILESIDFTDMASIMIACIALVFTIIESRRNKKFYRISVKPSLVSFLDAPIKTNNEIKVNLANEGLGPAEIISYCVKIDDKKYAEHDIFPLRGALKEIFNNYKIQVNAVEFKKGYCIAANKNIELFRVYFKGNSKPDEVELHLTLERLNIEIRYQSAYGEEMSILNT